jgi:hypothetical protein
MAWEFIVSPLSQNLCRNAVLETPAWNPSMAQRLTNSLSRGIKDFGLCSASAGGAYEYAISNAFQFSESLFLFAGCTTPFQKGRKYVT